MKRKFYEILCICLVGLLSSCQKSDDNIMNNQKIKLNVAGINQQQTRAGNDHIDDLKNSDVGFGVFVKTSNMQTSIGTNHQIWWNGNEWSNRTEAEGGESMLWEANNSINIYAYHPHIKRISVNGELIISGKISLHQNYLEHLQRSDLVVAKKENVSKSYLNPIIDLTFQHALVKLRFKINLNNNINIQSAFVHSDYLDYQYDLINQVIISSGNNSTPIGMYCTENISNVVIAEAIIPGLLLKSSSPFFFFTTTENGVEKTYNFNLTEDMTIKANHIYDFNVNINNVDDELEGNVHISDVAITKWTEYDSSDFLTPKN